MRRPLVWFFDLDDTLMWNSNTYNQPFIDLIHFLTEIFRDRIPCIEVIASFQGSVDKELGKQTNPTTGKPYLFSRDRYPDSFVKTYEWLCKCGFGEYNKTVALQCREIGMRTFEQANYRRLGFVPNGEEVLNFLYQRHPLVLVTLGDEWVQQKKVDALNLGHWFRSIHIVPEKTRAAYEGVLGELNHSDKFKKESGGEKDLDPADIVMVGNSFSSDIGPSLAAGMSAIFIPCMTSRLESIDPSALPEDAPLRMETFKEIKEIIPWYQTLEP